MLDPFPPPPAFLSTLTAPLARTLNLTTLPLHIHEVIFAAAIYTFIYTSFSPWISSRLFPRTYASFNARTRLNWDVHVVSLVQSLLVNGLALWVMVTDTQRADMDWKARTWGYTGAGGMVQAFAAGYFVWDLVVSARHVDIFGWGVLAHAASALAVFSLGFRPFVNFYGPTFILYELSSPFLNFHWFFDKVNMTGSKAQWYNGIMLIGTFFCCRLVWGTWQTFNVFGDVRQALRTPGTLVTISKETAAATTQSADERVEIMRFAGERIVPVWLALVYLGANLTLNALNWVWFAKMIETVRKRFKPKVEETKDDGLGGNETLKSEVDGFGEQVVTVEKTEVRKRRKA